VCQMLDGRWCAATAPRGRLHDRPPRPAGPPNHRGSRVGAKGNDPVRSPTSQTSEIGVLRAWAAELLAPGGGRISECPRARPNPARIHNAWKAFPSPESRLRTTPRNYDPAAAEDHRVEWAVLCDDVLCDGMCPRGTQFRVRTNGAVPATRANG